MTSLIITRGRWVLTNTCSDMFLCDCYNSIPWQHLRHKKRRRCRSLHTHTQPHLPLLHHTKPEQTLATGSYPPTSPPPTSHVPLEEKLASMKLHNSAPARLQSLQRKKVMDFHVNIPHLYSVNDRFDHFEKQCQASLIPRQPPSLAVLQGMGSSWNTRQFCIQTTCCLYYMDYLLPSVSLSVVTMQFCYYFQMKPVVV